MLTESVDTRPALKASEVAVRLNCPVKRVWALIADGHLAAYRVGRLGYRVEAAELERFIREGGVPDTGAA